MSTYQSRSWEKLFETVSEKAKDNEQYREFHDLMLSIIDNEFSKKDTGKEVADVIVRFSNSMSPDTEGFVKEITNSHRTLQQNVFRIFKETLKEWASVSENELMYDLRNEATVKQSKMMIDATKEESIPNI